MPVKSKQKQDEWRVSACNLLNKGRGVEDIAIALDVPVDDVRRLVRALRESGRLKEVLFGERDEHGRARW